MSNENTKSFAIGGIFSGKDGLIIERLKEPSRVSEGDFTPGFALRPEGKRAPGQESVL